MKGDTAVLHIESIGHITHIRRHEWEPPAWNTPSVRLAPGVPSVRRKRVNKKESPINAAILAALTGNEGKFLVEIRNETKLMKSSVEQAVIRLEKAGLVISEKKMRNEGRLARPAKFCRMVQK